MAYCVWSLHFLFSVCEWRGFKNVQKIQLLLLHHTRWLLLLLSRKQYNHFAVSPSLKKKKPQLALGSAVRLCHRQGCLPPPTQLVTVIPYVTRKSTLPLLPPPLIPTGLTCGHEGVATLCQDLHEVVGEVSASQVQTHDGVGQGVALIDGHVVGDTIARVQHNAWGVLGTIKVTTAAGGWPLAGLVEGKLLSLLFERKKGKHLVGQERRRRLGEEKEQEERNYRRAAGNTSSRAHFCR